MTNFRQKPICHFSILPPKSFYEFLGKRVSSLSPGGVAAQSYRSRFSPSSPWLESRVYSNPCSAYSRGDFANAVRGEAMKKKLSQPGWNLEGWGSNLTTQFIHKSTTWSLSSITLPSMPSLALVFIV